MLRIECRLDTIAGRVVEGSAIDHADPARPMVIEFQDGDRLLGSTVAVLDPLASGPDAPRQFFSFLLPPDVFDGNEHVITAVAAGAEGTAQSAPLRVVGHAPEPAAAPARPAMEIPSGSLDLVSEDGWVLGWAWYPNSPEERVEIEFLVDGELAGTSTAASYRADVAAAGVGDGNYGFSWALPYHVLTQARACLISARDAKTGHILPEPRRFQQMAVVDALEKVAALENDLRQLTAAIALRDAAARADQQGAADLFKTVGDFFTQLAAATAAGQPPGALKTLKNAVAEVTSGFRPFAFEAPQAPDITICLEACAPLPLMYQQLRAIRDSIGTLAVEIILIDAGAHDDTALLPLVVRNMRYLRLRAGPAARCNEAARAATGRLVLFLTERAVPAEGWLEAVSAEFAMPPQPAVLAAKCLGADGMVEHAGVEMAEDGLAARGHRRDPEAAPYTEALPVDAAAAAAFAVSREAWMKLRGLDENYAGLGPALADFCLRARLAGGAVRFSPAFCMTQLDETAGHPPTERDDAGRLRSQAAALAIKAAE
jgi:GT2 family glycosyltransferase